MSCIMLVKRCLTVACDTGRCRGGIAASVFGSGNASSRGILEHLVSNSREIFGVVYSGARLLSGAGSNVDTGVISPILG